ncbi:MAG: hypothetical protein HYY62_00725 [Deltaproteobacteria bacterium]|nr:hypothetical protein [Deltaproteobacteria bacterium]
MTAAKVVALKKCHYKECPHSATTGKFCRLHYMMTWQKTKNLSRESKEKMLDRYIKAITKKFPDDYLDVIKKDLSSEESFKKSVHDLDLENMSDLDFLDDYGDIIKKIKR